MRGLNSGAPIRNVVTDPISSYQKKRDVKFAGAKVGPVANLLPTLARQYYLLPEGLIRPYAGVGLNYMRLRNVKRNAVPTHSPARQAVRTFP